MAPDPGARRLGSSEERTERAAVVKFGKRSTPTGEWTAVPAEIRDVKYGLVHTTDSGVGGMYESHSSTKKLFLQVEPPGAPPYEATLKIERGGPSTPDVPGTRVDVLVDPSDPQQVALPDDPTFTLPGGRTWQPEHGLAGALADASRRGDAQEVMRLTAEIHANAASAPAATTAAAPDALDQLEKLGKLHASGVLTDEEFTAQKAKLLATGG
jgi:hypothetical protein